MPAAFFASLACFLAAMLLAQFGSMAKRRCVNTILFYMAAVLGTLGFVLMIPLVGYSS